MEKESTVDKKFKKLASNTTVFAIGSIGSKFITFLLVPIYTNALNTSEYGTTEIVITATNLLMPFLSLSMQDSVLRFGLAPEIDSNKVIKNAVIIVSIGSIISCLATPIYGLYSVIGEWAVYFSALIVLNMFRTIFSLQAKVLDKNVIFTIDVLIYSALTCVLSYMFLIVFKQGIEGYFNALIISNVISVAFLCISCNVLKSIYSAAYDAKLMKQMIRFSVPLIFNAVSWWIANSSDRLMLDYFCGTSDVGLYSVAAKIPSIITSITGIFNQAWMISSVNEYDTTNDKSFYTKTFEGYNFVLIVLTAIAIIFIRPFMLLYVGIGFHTSWVYVPFLLVGAIFYSYANFFGAIYMSAKKNYSIMATTLVAALANLVLNYIMIPLWGIQGAVVATMISYMTVGIYRMLGSRAIVDIQYNVKQLFASFALLIVESTLIIMNVKLMILAVLAVFLILYIYRTKIIALLTMLRRKMSRTKVSR